MAEESEIEVEAEGNAGEGDKYTPPPTCCAALGLSVSEEAARRRLGEVKGLLGVKFNCCLAEESEEDVAASTFVRKEAEEEEEEEVEVEVEEAE